MGMRARAIAGLSMLLGVACSADEVTELSPSARIGAEGGAIALDEVRLDVPRGALDAPRTLTVSVRQNVAGLDLPGEAVSAVYTFDPEGLRFAVPAEVTFEVSDASAHVIVWSRADDPTSLEPIETRDEGTRLVAEVSHFSAGAVVRRAAAPSDAGVPDAADEDSGPADAGDLDAEAEPDAAPLDAGAPDAEPADLGPPDAGSPDAAPEDAGFVDAAAPDAAAPDAGFADAGFADAAAPDAAPADAGFPDAAPVDAGVAVVSPASIPDADACQTQTVPLSVPGHAVTAWRLLTYSELSQAGYIDPPYGGASVDPATGVLTLAPTGTMISYPHVVGVEASLAGGGAVQRVWSIYAAGIGAYAVSQGGGPAVFMSATLPSLSQANAGAWTPVQVAMPPAQHPCSIRLVPDLFGSGCPNGQFVASFLGIDAQGRLEVTDPSFVPLVTPGQYCFAVNAEWGTSPIILDSATYFVDVVP